MSRIALAPEALKGKIEQHFESKGLKVDLQISSSTQSGGKILYICLIGEFSEIRNLEFIIYFNRNNKLMLNSFDGICLVTDLIKMLSEFQTAIDNI